MSSNGDTCTSTSATTTTTTITTTTCATSSRYSAEFEQLEYLGKGAFGVVFRAR